MEAWDLSSVPKNLNTIACTCNPALLDRDGASPGVCWPGGLAYTPVHVRSHTDVQSKNEPTNAHGQSLPHPPSLAFQEGWVAPRLIPSSSQITLLSMWNPSHRAFLCISRMYASPWACSHYNRPRISVSKGDTQTYLRPRTSLRFHLVGYSCSHQPACTLDGDPAAPDCTNTEPIE